MFLIYYLKAPTPEPEPELTEADLPCVQEAVSTLQQEYDDAVVVKHNLQNDVHSCSERLKAATDLLQRYVPQVYYQGLCHSFITDVCATGILLLLVKDARALIVCPTSGAGVFW